MPQQRDSLLAQHQRILGYNKGIDQKPHPSDWEEQSRIERLRLPPLYLPQTARPQSFFANLGISGARWWGFAAMAALMLVAILWPKADESLRIKGTHHISIFWEREGHVEPWTGGTFLQAGDRVRAEVLASDNIIAYAGIADHEGKLLLPPEQFHATAQTLAPGERKAFPGSFKLVGPSEGETLVVLICEKKTLATRLLEQVQSLEKPIMTRNQLPKGCDMQLFPLR